MNKDRSPEELKILLRDYIGITADLTATFSSSEITSILNIESEISDHWQYIDDEDKRIRRQLGSLRLKERLSQIPYYNE